MIKQYKFPIFLTTLVIIAIILFLPYFRLGIYRDEGVFLCIGDQILKGALPYKDCFDHKPPAIYYLMAIVITLLGKSIVALKATVLSFNIGTAIIIFFIGKKIFSENIGVISSFLFIVGMSLPAIEGFYAQTEPFLVFFSTLGILLFIIFHEKENNLFLLLSGVSIGISILFKQSAIFTLFPILIFFILQSYIKEISLKRNLKKISIIIPGVLFPILFVISYFWLHGALNEFFYDVITFNKIYSGMFLNIPLMIKSHINIFKHLGIILILAIISSVYICWKSINENNKNINIQIVIVIWLVLSFIPTFIRALPYYYVQVIPPVSLFASVGIIETIKGLTSPNNKNIRFLKVFVVVCLMLFLLITAYYNVRSLPADEKIIRYMNTTYEEQVQIGEYIEANTVLNEYIYAFDTNPEVYVLSNRSPPTKYIYLLPWNSNPVIQKEIIEDISRYNIQYIVVSKGRIYNNGTHAYAPLIYNYIIQNYHIVKSIGNTNIYKKN